LRRNNFAELAPGFGSDLAVPIEQNHPREIGFAFHGAGRDSNTISRILRLRRDQSEGLSATYHFTFTGEEECEGTVVIRDKTIQVQDGLVGTADMHVTADSQTWLDFLAKEKNLIWALVQRKLRMKGSPRLMKAFARCFP